MALDLKKNKDSLQKAYSDVVDDKSNTSWAVFGYEGNTPVFKVYETGEGDIDDMVEELNSGKIMYGYCRVKDPNTDLPKYVLVNWQGEGAPDGLKLKCTQHLRDVTNFLKTIHVTVNARTEVDVDADDIVKKVAKSSGSNYSFHKEKARPQEAPAPVGSVYQKTVPGRDIKTSSRDKFWAQTEVEEQKRQEEERKRAIAEREQLDKERKEREAREAKERDQRMQEKMKAVAEQKRAEREANAVNKENEKNKWEKEQQELYQQDEERRKQSEHARKERVQEAASLTGSSSSSARQYFKQKSVERPEGSSRQGPPPPRKIKHGFLSESQDDEEPQQRKAPIMLPTEEPSSPTPNVPPSKPARQSDPIPEPEPEEEYEPESVYQTAPDPEPEPEAEPEQPQVRNLLRDGLPVRQNSDEENNGGDWDDSQSAPSGPPPAPARAPLEEQDIYQDTEPGSPSGGKGLCATALYDYQAADDSEISFDPGEIITNIEQIDDGWWTGTAPDGSVGMFPANYVEIIE